MLQDLLERAQQLVAAQARQRQRPPGDTQLHAERRLVRTVPADVTDHRVDRAVRSTDRVVEVAAEQGARTPRPVAGGEAERGALQEGRGQQAAFQTAVLLGAHPALGEPPLGRVGTLAFHRVPDRPAQQPTVQLVPEEVVLGAHTHRLGAALGVARRGEREHGVPGRELQHPPQYGELVVALDPAGGGQGEVQQDAVDVIGEQPHRLGEVAGGAHTDRPAGRVQQLGHDRGAAGVVLDHQQGEAGAGGSEHAGGLGGAGTGAGTGGGAAGARGARGARGALALAVPVEPLGPVEPPTEPEAPVASAWPTWPVPSAEPLAPAEPSGPVMAVAVAVAAVRPVSSAAVFPAGADPRGAASFEGPVSEDAACA